MRLVVALDHRFRALPDGSCWAQAGFPYSFWTRYLSVFDSVTVLTRVEVHDSVPTGWLRVDGEGVAVAAVPAYSGLAEYLRRIAQVKRAVTAVAGEAAACIARLGSQVGSILIKELTRKGHPYGAEVVGDPYDVFSPGSVRHPLRPALRQIKSRRLRRQCRDACAVSYVTREALQRRYPPRPGTFTTHYSIVSLPPEAFVAEPKVRGSEPSSPARLITVGSLAQLYKGTDILLDALHSCICSGLKAELVVVGDGRHRREMEGRVRRLGIGRAVSFRGQLTAGEPVRTELDRADLFVLPSRTEGLPRAMLEAMARGLPCIGSTVGGIPELLSQEDMVPPNDADALATKIRDVVTEPGRMAAMSARNLARAHEYRDEVLDRRRVEFYRVVHDATARFTRGGDRYPH